MYVFPKGMVDVLAENYHNIWAKKKKTDLGSKGDSLVWLIPPGTHTHIHAHTHQTDGVRGLGFV